ncbi:MAG TPA: glycosyltransferase family 4 protein [Solirubrobacteraceae bacterium]|nr:glycosyltransferase family 4 protein [Solirubrobacteraceae bacterium]
MILFLHNRYRTTGGEERVVQDLLRLVPERLGESAELLARDSSPARLAAGRGLLWGGLGAGEVSAAVRLTGARIVHAHNLQPTLGWRALAAARAQGARVVLHLHQYRLVCAVGVCYTGGRECTRCHGRNTLPGVIHGGRGSRPEALAYAAALALWQRRIVDQADAIVVPSAFARERLHELGAPLPWERVHVLAPPVWGEGHREREGKGQRVGEGEVVGEGEGEGEGERERAGVEWVPRSIGSYALLVSRLSPEKGIDVAIDACAKAGIALVIAGDGPQRESLQALAGDHVRFVGRVGDHRLAELRAGATLALVPSRSAETFGLAAAEAMTAGLPVIASRIGALPELVGEEELVPPGDASALAGAIDRLRADPDAGERARERAQSACAPAVVAHKLTAIYDAAAAPASHTLPRR